MRSFLIGFTVITSLVASAGCCKTGSKSSSTATSFAGVYSSNWGDTTFTQTGTNVHATYPRGSMNCKATGKKLSCRWTEKQARGKAQLEMINPLTISGTWGRGTSATNGGVWVFKKK